MPDFCFYERCPFEVILRKQVSDQGYQFLSEEI